jgi:TRAP transporter TAXI family solute receptor
VGSRSRKAAAVVLAAVMAAACNPQEIARQSGGKRRLSLATGGTGGVYYPYGGAIARVISEHLTGVEATAEVTAASVDNLKLIRARKSDIAFTTADTLDDAIRGRGAFASGGPVQARALAVLYSNYTHLVAHGASRVSRVADLTGKLVSLGAAGSGTELIATRILRAAGVDPGRDLSVDALKDGKIDAFFWSGGVPTAAVLDLANTPGVRWRLVPNDDVLESLQSTYGASLYSRLSVPRAAYAGLPADVAVVGVSNLLVVNTDMPEQLAYDVTRLLFEHQPELVAVHPEAARLSLATASTGSPAPYHPGAIRYYRERGHWKE